MTAPSARRAFWKHPAFRIAMSAAMLSFLFWVLPFHEIRAALGSIPAVAFPVAIASYMLLHLIGIAKWRMLVNVTGAGLPFRDALRAYYWGLFGNTFLPSIVGGDVVRMGMAMRSARSKTGLVLGSVVDRTLDIFGLAFVAGIGALLSPRALDPQSRRVLLGVLAVCLAAGLVLSLTGRPALATSLFTVAAAVLVLMPLSGVVAVLAEEVSRRDWWFAAIAIGVLALIATNLRKLVP